jgi:molybdopterin/thiamine biosynthesis adenylyltransferase
VRKFNIADYDTFDLANFNRQVGATISTLGRRKLDVLAAMVKDVNPEAQLKAFPNGINRENISAFLGNVDLYVDGLDFFAFEARRAVFAECDKLRVPAVTAAPLGMGVALLNFMPGKMTFEEYFKLEGLSEPEQALRFLLGLSPALLQRGYLVDRSRVDFSTHRGPSTVMACNLCAGVATTEALKILLKRGPVLAAPHGMQFDAYRGKLVKTWRPWGNRNPIQRISLAIARRLLRPAEELERRQ